MEGSNDNPLHGRKMCVSRGSQPIFESTMQDATSPAHIGTLCIAPSGVGCEPLLDHVRGGVVACNLHLAEL